jgi:hypothetical protein
MYKVAEYIGAEARRFAKDKAPLGMGLGGGLADRAETIVIHGSSFDDPGEDFTKMVAFDNEGVKLATITLNGY